MIYITSNKKILEKKLPFIDDPKVKAIITKWIYYLPHSECKMYCTLKGRILEAFVITHNNTILTSFTAPECRPSNSVSDIMVYILTN